MFICCFFFSSVFVLLCLSFVSFFFFFFFDLSLYLSSIPVPLVALLLSFSSSLFQFRAPHCPFPSSSSFSSHSFSLSSLRGFKLDTAVARMTLLEDIVPKAGDKGATSDGTFAESRYNYEADCESPLFTDHDENWYSEKPVPVDDGAAAELAARKLEAWKERQKKKEDIKSSAAKDKEIDAAKAEKAAAEAAAKEEEALHAEELQEAKKALLETRAAENEHRKSLG